VKFTNSTDEDGSAIFIDSQLLAQELEITQRRGEASVSVEHLRSYMQKLQQQHNLLFVGEKQQDIETVLGISGPTVGKSTDTPSA